MRTRSSKGRRARATHAVLAAVAVCAMTTASPVFGEGESAQAAPSTQTQSTETHKCTDRWNQSDASDSCSASVSGVAGALGVDTSGYYCMVNNIYCSVSVEVESEDGTESHTLTWTSFSQPLTPDDTSAAALCVTGLSAAANADNGGYGLLFMTASPPCAGGEYTIAWTESNTLPDRSTD